MRRVHWRGRVQKVTHTQKIFLISSHIRSQKSSTRVKTESAVLGTLSVRADLIQSQSTVGAGFPQLTPQSDKKRSSIHTC